MTKNPTLLPLVRAVRRSGLLLAGAGLAAGIPIAAQAQSQGVTLEEAERRMAANISVRRIIDARDIANVIAFLASPLSVAINGDVIAAGGGAGRAIHY